VANMASIMADIGDRSAPAADGAARRAGPSRICIGISSPPPSPRIPHAGSRRPQHGPAMGPAAEISGPRPPVPRRPWVLEGSRTRRGGSCWWRGGSEGWTSRPVGALRTVSVVFRLQRFGIWMENPMKAV
jgi:hypothetical protein